MKSTLSTLYSLQKLSKVIVLTFTFSQFPSSLKVDEMDNGVGINRSKNPLDE
jgi:hypothetical protein